jgi:hypothetical protein
MPKEANIGRAFLLSVMFLSAQHVLKWVSFRGHLRNQIQCLCNRGVQITDIRFHLNSYIIPCNKRYNHGYE